jgi:hypothetical protein
MPPRSAQQQRSTRPLICFIGTLRALDLTAASLTRHLIEALDADVAICVSRLSSQDEESLALLEGARIVDCCIYEDAFQGYESMCDGISHALATDQPEPFPWRKAIAIDGNWLGGLPGRSGSGMHLNYNFYKLNQQLQSPSITAGQYTHFIITRTDFQWLAPHPPLELMDQRLVWIPEGEDYQGCNDRHAVCSRRNVEGYLSFLDTLIRGKAYSYLKPYKGLNHEYQLKLHLIHQGIRVGRFRNLAYLTGTKQTQTNWSGMKVKQIDGVTYHCKYPGEVDSSTANSMALADHRDPRQLIMPPSPLGSRLPIWKARLRSLYPWRNQHL